MGKLQRLTTATERAKVVCGGGQVNGARGPCAAASAAVEGGNALEYGQNHGADGHHHAYVALRQRKDCGRGACRCVAADRKRNRLALRRPPYSRVGAVPSTLRRVEEGQEGRAASVEQTFRLSRAHVSVLRRASATVQLSGSLCPLPAWFKTRSAFLLPRAVAILLLIRLLMTSHVRGQERGGGVRWRNTFLRPSSACAWVCACLYRCSCVSSVLPQDRRHHH